MKDVFAAALENNKSFAKLGNVATYIPELSKANPQDVGIYGVTIDGKEYCAGDYDKKFTIQSISKIIVLILALQDNGPDKVFSMIGVEPTGDGFNSIVNLETKDLHKPYNPMINAGAILASSLIKGSCKDEKIERILKLARTLSGNQSIEVNHDTFFSEKLTGDRNRALAYFMKSFNSMQGDVDEILDIYFSHCSIAVTCKDLAMIGAVLANDGIIPKGERVVSKGICRITKTLMVTCGLYDASGEFAFHVGIPAKSGVGGGILAAVPKKMGIGVYAPALDEKGNSVVGVKMLKELSEKLELSIF